MTMKELLEKAKDKSRKSPAAGIDVNAIMNRTIKELEDYWEEEQQRLRWSLEGAINHVIV